MEPVRGNESNAEEQWTQEQAQVDLQEARDGLEDLMPPISLDEFTFEVDDETPSIADELVTNHGDSEEQPWFQWHELFDSMTLRLSDMDEIHLDNEDMKALDGHPPCFQGVGVQYCFPQREMFTSISFKVSDMDEWNFDNEDSRAMETRRLGSNDSYPA